MLDNCAFRIWCQRLSFNQHTHDLIQQIRTATPSRRVQSRRGNVVGSYPSCKMGVTIQFESHRSELARIYELEHDPDVLEYYDQPPAIPLDYLSRSGKRNRHTYTPDFFILRQNSAGWEECKPETELLKLTTDSPNRYQKVEGQWRCPPGEVHAAQFMLGFGVWSDAGICWMFQQNAIWLEDYLRSEGSAVKAEISQSLQARVSDKPGILLVDLLQQQNPDDLYSMIATGRLYVNLHAVRLAEPDRVPVYPDQATAIAYERATELVASPPLRRPVLAIAVGSNLVWDGQSWTIVNTGTSTTGLLRSDQTFVELPNATLETLIYQGKITALNQAETTLQSDDIQAKLRSARPEDIAEANRRYEQLQPYLEPDAPATPNSILRRWRLQYRRAEALYGSGYLGLLPSHTAKGNRSPKLASSVQAFMTKFIEEHYETLKHQRAWRVYQSFVLACETQDPPLTAPSAKSFYTAIKRRSGMEQTEKREGRRAAIQKRPSYLELELTTPRHGDRPFEIVHIDHTQLDIELVSSLGSLVQCNLNSSATPHNLGRPWVTFMVDAFSRRLLAVYVTYEEPSYRPCMAVLRICVQRFNRFPHQTSCKSQ